MNTAHPANSNNNKVSESVKNTSLDNVLDSSIMTKQVKKIGLIDQIIEFMIKHFWILAILLLVLSGLLLGYFFYTRYPEVPNLLSEITGQNTPANSIKRLIKGYRDHNLSDVEKYADIDNIVDGIVDSLVDDLKNDRRYSVLFGTDDVKELFNDKITELRSKYKKDFRNSVTNGDIDLNWKEIGKVFLDDSFSAALDSGNLTINGNEAQFEIATSKGILIVKMAKVRLLWKVQSIVAKDNWSSFLGN